MNRAAIDIQTLSVAERIQLAEDLWDSIATDAPSQFAPDAELRAEIERRLAAHALDPASAIPWDIVRAELFNPKR